MEYLVKFHGKGTVCEMAIQETEQTKCSLGKMKQNGVKRKWKSGSGSRCMWGPRYEISTLQPYRDGGCWKDNYMEGEKHNIFFSVETSRLNCSGKNESTKMYG